MNAISHLIGQKASSLISQILDLADDGKASLGQ